MMYGYVLAKADKKFLVMPEKFYKSEMLKKDWECKNNLDKLMECTLGSGFSFPKDLYLDKYDYKVQYDNKNNSIIGLVLKENGEPETKGKKVYLLGNYNYTNNKTGHIVLTLSNDGTTLVGFKKNFEPNEGIEKSDLFLCCLISDINGKSFIGYAKKIAKSRKFVANNGWNKVNKDKEKMSDKLQGKIAEEAFYQDANGKDLRFGVLSGYFIDDEKKKNITEACIDDAFYFPLNLMSESLRNTWINCSVNSKTNGYLYKMLVAYYMDNESKKITKVLDAMDVADEVTEKATGLKIPWQRYTFKELSYKESSNAQKMSLKLEAGETVDAKADETKDAEFLLKVKSYTGEDVISQQRIELTLNKKKGTVTEKIDNEDFLLIIEGTTVFWCLPVKIRQKNGEIISQVLDVKETIERVNTIEKTGHENYGSIRYFLKTKTKDDTEFRLAQVQKINVNENTGETKIAYGWRRGNRNFEELQPNEEELQFNEEELQSNENKYGTYIGIDHFRNGELYIREVSEKYKKLLDRALEMSAYYAKYEKNWTDYRNFKEYKPLQFRIEKNPNFKVIINKEVDLRILLSIQKVCDNINDLPYSICCSFAKNKIYKGICDSVKEKENNIKSYEDWWPYFFAAHTQAELLFKDPKNENYELKIARCLKKIFVKGMDFSAVFDKDAKEETEDKDNKQTYNLENLSSYEQWAVDIAAEYIKRFNEKTEEQQKEFKEWMLQSILNLHTFFSYELVKQFKNMAEEEEFTKYLGVSKAEVDTLVEVVWKREVILNDAVTLEDRVKRIKEICDVKIRKNKTFADFAYNKDTRKKWNAVCQYVLEQEKNLGSDEQYKELADFILDLKKNPNKAIVEIIFKPFPKSDSDSKENKDLEYSSIVAAPELSLSMVDKEVFKTQSNLRIRITNEEQPRNVLTRMLAYITKAEATVSWKNNDNETKNVIITTPEEYEKNPIKIAGGESKVLNLSLEDLKKEEVWENAKEELSLTVTVTYTDFLANKEAKRIVFSQNGKENLKINIAEESWETKQAELWKKVGDNGDAAYFENQYLSNSTTDEKQNFFGRKKEIKKIADWILRQDVKHICISGQKQCGKSSLCKHIFDFKEHSLKTNHLFNNVMKTPDSYTDVLVLYYPTVSQMCKSGYTSDNVIERMKGAIVKDLMEVLKKNYSKEKLQEEALKDLLQKYESISLDESQIEQVLQALPEEVVANITSRGKKVKFTGGALRLFTSKLDEMEDDDFDEWMKKFNALMESENKKYKIIVAIDEFTNLCKIEERNNKLKDILEEILINAFSASGGVDNIYVLAIGHEAMRIQLDKYITHNGIKKQYRNSIELKDLEPDDVKDLIVKAFGLDKQEDLFNLFTIGAFNKLWELSGGNAPILKLILFQVYTKYRIGEFGSCITELDVISETNEFILELGKSNDIFDPFFNENSEDAELNNAILNYLMKVAINIKDIGCCKRNDIADEKYTRFGEEQERSLYEILLKRDILVDDKEIKVKVGVLVEYLYQIYGTEFKEKGIITWKQQN